MFAALHDWLERRLARMEYLWAEEWPSLPTRAERIDYIFLNWFANKLEVLAYGR